MFTACRAPPRGVWRHAAVSGVVIVSDTVPDHSRRRASAVLSSPVPSGRKGHRSRGVFAPVGGVLRHLRRDPSPTRSHRTATPGHTRSNGSSVPEVPRFSSLQCRFIKLHCQREIVRLRWRAPWAKRTGKLDPPLLRRDSRRTGVFRRPLVRAPIGLEPHRTSP